MNHSQQSNSYLLESLEQRVLLSADPLAVAATDAALGGMTSAAVVDSFDGADISSAANHENDAFAGLSGADLSSEVVTGLALQLPTDAGTVSSEGETSELPAGALILGAGANASLRSDAATSGSDEHFKVEKLEDKYRISYLKDGEVLGLEDYSGVTAIYFDGGAGDDVLELGDGVDVPVIAHGGSGQDVLKVDETNGTVSLRNGQMQNGSEGVVGFDGFDSVDLDAAGGSVTVDDKVALGDSLKISADSLSLKASLEAKLLDLAVNDPLTVEQPSVSGGDSAELILLKAESLRIAHGAGVGSVDQPVLTQVDTLEVVATGGASNSGGVYITELDGVTIGDVVTAGETDSGITTNGGDVSVLNLSGELVVADGGIDAGGGDIALTTDVISVRALIRS